MNESIWPIFFSSLIVIWLFIVIIIIYARAGEYVPRSAKYIFGFGIVVLLIFLVVGEIRDGSYFLAICELMVGVPLASLAFGIEEDKMGYWIRKNILRKTPTKY
jgi:hypothetical protein